MLKADFGKRLMQRLDEIAERSEGGSGVTRLPFTAEHRQAAEIIRRWMESAGLEVGMDAAGTLVGRRQASRSNRSLLMGSHQDSIRQGGRFDGILGIALPLLVLEDLRDASFDLGVEVLAFADEEGVRFPTALIGPRALAGTLRREALGMQDESGTSVAEALNAFGGDAEAALDLRRDPEAIAGYLEVHIEQGPVLENEDLPVGIVSGICGIERWQVTITGEAAHAGTAPMALRRDALAGAAEVVLALESICRDTEEQVGVVGRLAVGPGVVNAVPESARFTVELRALEDAVRERSAATLEARVREICETRRLDLEIDRSYAQPSVACDGDMRERLAAAIGDAGHRPRTLMSGATHDASAMANLCPVSMLFVRCERGISHNPAESVTEADLVAAGEVLGHFLERSLRATS